MKFDSNNAARKISEMILKMQIAFVLFMGRITSGYSGGSLKVGLIVCCLMLSALSSWFIIDAFKKKPAAGRIVTTHIKFIPLLKKQAVPGIILTQHDYERLQQFRSYMDSLQLSKPGKIKFDSILKTRPGLMDSVSILETIYLSQQK